MRCLLLVMGLVGSLAMRLQAEEKQPAKPPADYCNVELRGTLEISPNGGELVDVQGIAFSATAGGHNLIFGENKELAAAAKKLDGKKVLINGHPRTWSPLSAVAPTTFIPYIEVTAIKAADEAEEKSQVLALSAEEAKEATALVKGLVVTGTLTKVIGGLGSPGTPAAGDAFELEFDKLPHLMLKFVTAEANHGTHYIPLPAPLQVVHVKQSAKVDGPRRTAIHLSAKSASNKLLIQVLAESLEKGSKVRIYLYVDSGFLGSMAEAEGVLK
jgi:hypothetical protein